MERTPGTSSSLCVRVKNQQILVRSERYANRSQMAQCRFAVWSTHTRICFVNHSRAVCKPFDVLVYTRLFIWELLSHLQNKCPAVPAALSQTKKYIRVLFGRVNDISGWLDYVFASTNLLSLGTPFRYIFLISVALFVSSLQYYDACTTIPVEEVTQMCRNKHNVEWTAYMYMRLTTCYNIALSAWSRVPLSNLDIWTFELLKYWWVSSIKRIK